jgi:hypothetical protein
MTDEQQLWWQVRERLAAQAWSCDDTTWEATAVGGTVGSLLTRYADAGFANRLEVARSLQRLSDERGPQVVGADDVTTAWLDLRRIDAALGRPPIDLRSEVATFAGNELLKRLDASLVAAAVTAVVTISGPGFSASRECGAGGLRCAATMSWPTFVRLAAGTLAIEDSQMGLSGDEATIDTFLAAFPAFVGNP